METKGENLLGEPKTVMKGSSKEVIPNKKGEKLIKTKKDEIVR